MLKNVIFERSISTEEQFSHLLMDATEVGLIGRSNVGKSSLINALTNNNKMAKTSATPGKTITLNYFNVNKDFYLVDLPGYGYARRSKELYKTWVGVLEKFMIENAKLQHMILIIDFKVGPTNDDMDMVEYLVHNQIPFSVIASKLDKVKISNRKKQKEKISEKLGGLDFITYSVTKNINIDLVENLMYRVSK